MKAERNAVQNHSEPETKTLFQVLENTLLANIVNKSAVASSVKHKKQQDNNRTYYLASFASGQENKILRFD